MAIFWIAVDISVIPVLTPDSAALISDRSSMIDSSLCVIASSRLTTNSTNCSWVATMTIFSLIIIADLFPKLVDLLAKPAALFFRHIVFDRLVNFQQRVDANGHGLRD